MSTLEELGLAIFTLKQSDRGCGLGWSLHEMLVECGPVTLEEQNAVLTVLHSAWAPALAKTTREMLHEQFCEL